MPNELDKHAQRALTAKTEASLMNRLRAYINNSDPVEVAFWSIQFVALIALLIFEANNSGKGYVMLAKGAAPAFLAYFMGVACVVAYVSAHHRAADAFRAKRTKQAWQSVGVAVTCTMLAFVGVLSNVSSKTALSATTSSETNEERALVRAEILAIQAEATPEAINQSRALVSVTERQISAREDEATGWGLGDATQEDCRADLRPRERQICNDLNGDGQRMGLRNELEMHKARVLGLETKSERLSMLRTKLGSLQYTEGSAHWQAMERLTGGSVQQDALRIYISLFISLGLLLVLGMGCDALFEKIEDEIEEQDNG